MKPSSSQPRPASTLSDSLHHNLSMYVLTTASAGVSLLALSQPSEAKIIYTKTDVVIESNHIYRLDLNHDGVADFKISNQTFFTDTTIASLGASPAQSNNRVVGKQSYTGFPQSAYALEGGAIVGPEQPFSGALMAGSDGANRWGRWAEVSHRYLGLRFSIEGEVHYGWARLNVTSGGNRITGTLTGYAYETIPNKPIVAGETEGKDVITFRPASLGDLARGMR